MFGNRDIPVYLFTGFLESGKSTCFQEILEEGNFEDGLRTLCYFAIIKWTRF